MVRKKNNINNTLSVIIQEQDGLDVLDDDVPTDEAIERMEERLESATSAQKNLFLVIFQV